MKHWKWNHITLNNSKINHDEVRFRGVINNRSIAKHLAKKLNVHTNERIVQIENNNSSWIVRSHNGTRYSGNILILTTPVPQTIQLLQNSLIPIPVRTLLKLEQISYSRCIAVLALLKSESNIPKSGVANLDGGPVSWIADNHKKGISPNGFAVTIHANPKYSQENWKKEDDVIAEELFSFSEKWLKAEVAEYQVHHWRYSQVVRTFDSSFLHLKDYGSIFMSGDGFGGKGIEGAALSGIQVAKKIIENYK
jgi:renalase